MKIQKWLLPGKANKYHPHLLRPLGLSLVVAALIGINLTQNITAAHKFQVLGIATSISSAEIISLANQERANNGLPGLAYNAQLSSAAEAKARDMFAKDYWAHFAPDGTSPWYFINNAGYVYSTAGENLAKDFDTSAGVVSGWMNSPGHRANILNNAFKDTGIAVLNGTLQGSETTLVVAMYGAPRAAAPAPAPTAPKSTTTTAKSKTTTPVPTAATPAAPVAPAAPAPDPVTQPAPQVAATPGKATVVGVPAPTTAAKNINERSVSARESRTWAQNATLLLLSVLFLVSVLKHTVVWRTKKQGWRHVWLRAHPAAQYVLLLVAIVANLVSGIGVIR
jgi:uncharacterized protein YkwD